jgi:hypothetical protein
MKNSRDMGGRSGEIAKAGVASFFPESSSIESPEGLTSVKYQQLITIHILSMTSTDSEHALSEVVGFVLILGVLVMALAMYQLYVVPAQGRENEIAQMNTIKDRFTDYKISLDSLWVNNQTGMTLGTSIDLGTAGGATQGGAFTVSLLSPVASTGTLKVNQRQESISIGRKPASGDTVFTNFTMGEIEYVSGNNYWIQQTYYYQMGGVFLAQDQESGATVRVFPSLSIYNVSIGSNNAVTAKVKMGAIQLTGSQVIGGSGPVRIDTRLREGIVRESYTKQQNVTITVNAKDAKTASMWEQLFREAVRVGRIPDSWYEITGSGNSRTLDVWGNTTAGMHFDMSRAEYLTSLQSVAVYT